MMSHSYLVLADPVEAPLATGDRSKNTSAADGSANPSNLSLFISLPPRFSRTLRAHVQRLTPPGDSAAAVQPNRLERCLSLHMTLKVEPELNWADLHGWPPSSPTSAPGTASAPRSYSLLTEPALAGDHHGGAARSGHREPCATWWLELCITSCLVEQPRHDRVADVVRGESRQGLRLARERPTGSLRRAACGPEGPKSGA